MVLLISANVKPNTPVRDTPVRDTPVRDTPVRDTRCGTPGAGHPVRDTVRDRNDHFTTCLSGLKQDLLGEN